ncbi:MAG TPA: GDSL-type esterase/lipase family protein [Caldimonas sp.]|jgi:lysophospholipase L1-like esterase|nr:GDSL-type esterase/lipase family protein [Caldimonas sp.]HEX2542635.1 GDSL-type esterase/lipase family protein [Caldimonas sp.]
MNLPWARCLAYLVPVALTSGAALRLLQLRREVALARSLAAHGRAYERRLSSARTRILVLGDSTGVGIGASRPEESIAGLLAAEVADADIVNVSRSGARVADALAQARGCRERELRFDLALLHVGGNDVIRATPPAQLLADGRLLLAELAAIAGQTVWLGPPDVGHVPLFPPPLSWLLRRRTRRAAAAFAACAAAQEGATFVDFSAGEHASRFADRRPVHFAVDRLHPSSDTYRYGYTAVRRLLRVLDTAAT